MSRSLEEGDPFNEGIRLEFKIGYLSSVLTILDEA